MKYLQLQNAGTSAAKDSDGVLPMLRRAALLLDRKSGSSYEFRTIALAIANSMRDDQIRPRKVTHLEFIDLGVGLVALNRYDSRDRPHIVASVREHVLVRYPFRLGGMAVRN
ncbi:MAG TPA: hypothetical protein VKS24_01050 [Bradyrhizobium sp.]|nr:hypothetical protein [Bradyrhizobium sp.]